MWRSDFDRLWSRLESNLDGLRATYGLVYLAPMLRDVREALMVELGVMEDPPLSQTFQGNQLSLFDAFGE